ncbi:MAG TPA: tripartite tricarboxylate transporter substrate binding protein [Noviherbaspirillum sp.]|nr:tripartite tricarboxylate transporter substrate binding protein [Noviherbaspirillum sp.]
MSIISKKRRTVAALLAVCLTAPAITVQAQQQIRMIVANAAGSSVDSVARTISDPLSKALGQAIFVENIPGAGGTLGSAQLARAPKDGNTLGMVSNNHVVNPSLYKSMSYDTLRDFAPVTIVAGSPIVLVAHPSVPANNLKELIALAKSKPGEVNYGSSGNGTILHLTGEALAHQAGIKLQHIPYKGTGQLTSDVLGGQIQLAFLGVTGAAPHIKSGRLKALGVTTAARSTLLPDVAPFAEQGLPNYNMQGWIALIAPAGVPDATVKKLYSTTKNLLATPEFNAALESQGFTPMGTTPEATLGIFRNEMAQAAELVRQSGMKID